MENIREKILELKNKKNAVILAHNYQSGDVQLIADYLGDSLELSRIAAKTDNPLIVFAGVKFMAETAKILSPEKTVLLPRLDAGCPMADMITEEELVELKAKYPDAKVVTYVNSSVETKKESDVCCTSSNAVEVVRNIDADRVIFVPDRNLGAYVQSQVPEKEMIFFEGYCYVHNRIKIEDISDIKELHPEAEVIIHPEARKEVLDIADGVFSTSKMLSYVKESEAKEFIVATEAGLLERMERENPGKVFLHASSKKICSNMKRTTLDDIYRALESDQYRIEINRDTADRARGALEKMLLYS